LTLLTLPPIAQVVLAKAWNKAELSESVNGKMIEFANRGFRSLGLAMAEVREAGQQVDAVRSAWPVVFASAVQVAATGRN
jgi:hypothetical protein